MSSDPVSSTTRPPHAELFRAAALPAAIAAVVVTVIAGFTRGSDGVVGSLTGAAVVGVFFGLSLLVLRVTRDSDPSTALGLALISYTLKVLLLAVALILIRKAGLVDRPSFGWSAIVCAVAWLVGEVRGYLHLKLPYVEPEQPGSAV